MVTVLVDIQDWVIVVERTLPPCAMPGPPWMLNQCLLGGWMDGWVSRGMNESIDDTPIRIMHLEMCGLNEC